MTRSVAAVVIGTSAGGVEALGSLLPAFEPARGVPVLVVVHMPRERPSLLPELFASRCRLAVREAEDKQPLEPDTVYFAPPDYHLLVDAGPVLALSSDELVHYSRPAIDVLFESAADLFGGALLGIVLTGANADGAAGLAAVQRAGGLTLVQDPSSAAAAAMPEAALKAAPGSPRLTLTQLADLLRVLRQGQLPSQASVWTSSR